MWRGALIGTAVSAAFAAFFSFFKIVVLKARSLFPIKKVLGDIADNDSHCAIFLKELYSHDRYYYSHEPDFFPPHTANRESRWQNIPHVIADADVQAATDFTNLLGQVGKRENVSFRSLTEDWDLWSEHVLSVGGNFKTDRIFELANPRFVELVNNVAFRFSDSNQLFQGINGNDYGLIYRVTHPVTGKICIVLMGLGVRGTESAGYYFRTKAAILGKLFGGRDFAFLVHVRIDHGKETASPCWYLPEPMRIKKILHPILWYRSFKPLKENPV
jgi:hypothetical protein